MVEPQPQPRSIVIEPTAQENVENRPTAGVLHTTSGGIPSSSTSDDQLEESQSKRPRTEDVITFINNDLQNVQVPHEDPIVISLTIANHDVKQILVDNESSVDVLYYDAFSRISLSVVQL